MPTLVPGRHLSARQVAAVKASFVHRWTRENPHRTQVYSCTKCDIRTPYVNETSAEGHTHPTIPLISDQEWIEKHAFWVNADGSLTERRGAEPHYDD